MLALSVRQPWASLIASGAKTIELRSWSTTHRGDLLIAAGRAFDERGRHHGVDGPRASAACIASLNDVRPATMNDADAACVPPALMRQLLRDAQAAGRTLYAWCLPNSRAVPMVNIRGQLGLFRVDDAVIAVPLA